MIRITDNENQTAGHPLLKASLMNENLSYLFPSCPSTPFLIHSFCYALKGKEMIIMNSLFINNFHYWIIGNKCSNYWDNIFPFFTPCLPTLPFFFFSLSGSNLMLSVPDSAVLRWLIYIYVRCSFYTTKINKNMLALLVAIKLNLILNISPKSNSQYQSLCHHPIGPGPSLASFTMVTRVARWSLGPNWHKTTPSHWLFSLVPNKFLTLQLLPSTHITR